MSKQARQIVARGLTASSRGSVIEYYGNKAELHEVSYDPIRGKTIVRVVSTVELPNNLPITVWDR